MVNVSEDAAFMKINIPDVTPVDMCIRYSTAIRMGLKTQFSSDYALSILGYLHLIDIKMLFLNVLIYPNFKIIFKSTN